MKNKNSANVPGKIAKEWRPRALTATIIMIAAKVYERDGLDGCSKAAEMSERLHNSLSAVYDGIKDAYPVDVAFARMHRKGLEAMVGKVWGWRSEQYSAHVLEVMAALVEDVREYVGDDPEAAPWAAIADALEDAMAATDPEQLREGCENSQRAYTELQSYVWNKPIMKTDLLKMWIAGGRMYVVAKNRHEARQIVTRETGIVGLRVQGVPCDAKLWWDDGQLIGVAKDLAAGKARVIGRPA